MNAIAGWVDLRGAPIAVDAVDRVAHSLALRGPHDARRWTDGSVALVSGRRRAGGAETSSAMVRHGSGVVAVGDVRLDNRIELVRRLQLPNSVGDVELLVEARLRWGDRYLDAVVGDFTLAMWFPAQRRLDLLRDHLGARRLVHHLVPGRVFAFATDLSTLATIPGVVTTVDEARIADYFTDDLEGIDHTSTVYQDVYRLAPAHALTLERGRATSRRLWSLSPRTVDHRADERDHVEAFLEVFTRAVDCRIDDGGRTASMLSGGLDSGTVSWVAAELLAGRGAGALHTVSAVSADGDEIETRLARASTAAIGAVGHEVDVASFVSSGAASHALDAAVEPFDLLTPLVWAMYQRAAVDGFEVLLDGAAGDVVLTGGNRIGRLVLSGRLVTAYRSLTADEEHWDEHRTPAARVRSMVGASLPAAVRRALQRHDLADTPGSMPSELSPEFVTRVDLARRARASASAFDALPVRAAGHQRARLMSGSMLTVGIERYDRIAGMCGVECRSPFLDRRVADVLLGLPDHVLHDRGWHKMLLRRAGAGHLPPEVRWKRGRDHLGSGFLAALGEVARARFLDDRPARLESLHPFLSDSFLSTLERAEYIDLSDDDSAAAVMALLLADWLNRDTQKPRTLPAATV